MEILVLGEQEMRQAFSMEQAIEADLEALRLYAAGKANIPLRANLPVPEHNGECLYMYGYAAPAGALGVKIVSVYPDNPGQGLPGVPATMVLVDAATGQVCALLDGTWLTRLRTGAVSGAATRLLSREDSRVFALFGSGGQAATQLEAVLAVRPIQRVLVYDICRESRERFADEMSRRFGVEVIAAADPASAVAQADIVTTVTTSRKPVFDARLLKPGAHINAVGSYTPQMSEIDPWLVTHAGKIYVDTPDALLESGDLIQPIDAGLLRAEDITGQLGQLAAGETPGRESAGELTYFETVGSAVLDLVAAQRIYETALQQGMGRRIQL